MIAVLLLCVFFILRSASSTKYDSSTHYLNNTDVSKFDYAGSTLTVKTNASYSAYVNLSVPPRSTTFAYRNWPEYKAYMFFVDYFFFFTSIPGLITNPLSVFVAVKIRPTTTTHVCPWNNRYFCCLYKNHFISASSLQISVDRHCL